MYRTHTCGELNKTNVKQTATLSGWVNTRRDHGGLIFIDLRDRYGVTQCTFDPKRSKEAWRIVETVRSEFVVKITGTVLMRPEKMYNQAIDTGEIEIEAREIEILNPSKTPPFEIATEEKRLKETNEEVRLRYRYIDLRRRHIQENLIFRATVIKYIHDWMRGNNFIEVHTPLLTSSSPEGARDFLVPSRLHPGKFYALPQAPQQYKQLLMVGGMDRYYQIAPCMRDEDARADRSPGEFYQLDVETSFLTQDEFFALMEPLFIEITENIAHKKVWKKPFPRLTYKEIMSRYGSDRPDLRYGLELHSLTDIVKECGFQIFSKAIENGGVVKAICAPKTGEWSRSQIDELTEYARIFGAKGLAYVKVGATKNDEAAQTQKITIENSELALQSPILKFLSEQILVEIIKKTGATTGDIIFFGAGPEKEVNAVLSQIRTKIARDLGLIDNETLAWAWIVDFPMYEYDETNKKLDFAHNPFSMPQGGMKALENEEPLSILAHQYDIICNGLELSSGAVRNNRPDIMLKAFELAGYTEEDVRKKFGHMMAAFEYGAPPHCGFAPGIERLIMVLRDEPNIREVIAFPKNQKAQDLMMDAPSAVDPKQLKEVHIRVIE